MPLAPAHPRTAPAPSASIRRFAIVLVLAAVPVAASRDAAGTATPPGFQPLSTQEAVTMRPPPPGRAKEFALIRANGIFHMFYMRDDLLVHPDSTELEFGHAVSTDMVHWTQLSPVLHVRPGKWDNGHVWAPSVVEQNGIYYLYYVGVSLVPFPWNWYQRIGVATSTDLSNWTRYDEPVFTGHHVPWAYSDSSRFEGCQFRDPWVMPDPDHPGQWLMYFVTTPSNARDQLIVGVARNDGGLTPWRDVMPLWATNAAHYWGWVESPCVFRHGPLWYLFVTTNSGHVINFRTTPHPLADSTQWSGKYRLWDMVGQDPISDTWFGVEHVEVNGRDYLAYVNPWSQGIDIQEMVWGTPPNFFTLTTPAVLSAGSREPPSALGLAVVGRARGEGVVFRLSLPEAATVRLEVFDVAGRRVRTVSDGPLPRGESLATWDGRDASGARAERGVYFARLSTAAAARSVRVLVIDP